MNIGKLREAIKDRETEFQEYVDNFYSRAHCCLTLVNRETKKSDIIGKFKSVHIEKTEIYAETPEGMMLIAYKEHDDEDDMWLMRADDSGLLIGEWDHVIVDFVDDPQNQEEK